jgi:putative hydrolase of the HAD superfamily
MTSLQPHHTIVFDFGGVLLHWQPTELLQQVVPQHAPDAASAQRLAERMFQSFVPGGDWSEFDRGHLSIEQLAPKLAMRTGLSEADALRVIHAVPPHLQPQADTVELLHQLKRAGHRLYFLSNMPAPYADYLNREHAFVQCFDQGIYSSHIGLVKPEAAIFKHAQAQFELVPNRSIFIDDHPANVEQARALGWHAVHFTSAAQCAQALRSNWQIAV